jgi:beta-carotene 15,15'-dioxygenase
MGAEQSAPARNAMAFSLHLVTLRPFVLFKLAILPAITFALILVDRYVAGMEKATATAIASLLILLIGIPHGTLDVEIALERFKRHGLSARLGAISVYILAALAMWAVWSVMPSLALISFLILSIVHFAFDWDGNGERFFATTVGWALISVPALAHPHAVASIFEMLTIDTNGSTIAALLACTAIPAFFGSVMFAAKAFECSDYANGINVLTCLAAAIVLPPLVGFAVFFCGLHSPRHLGEAIRNAGAASRLEKIVRASAVMALALAAAALLFISQKSISIDADVIRVAFVLLSILTVPHFILELIIVAPAAKMPIG